MKTLTQLARVNDKRFADTLVKVNDLILQIEDDSLMVSSQVSDITREILRLLNQNSPKLNTIFTDVHATTSEFRQSRRIFVWTSTPYLTRFPHLSHKVAMRLKTGEANITPILEKSTGNDRCNWCIRDKRQVSSLKHSTRYSTKVKALSRSSSIPRNPLEEARRTLQNVNKAVNAITELSQQTERQIGRFKSPLQFGWDYELRYLSFEERLYNELAFSFSPQSKAHYRIGVGVRDEKVRFEIQYAHDVNDYLRARAGFMRSRVGASVDLWLWSRRIGLSLEGIGLTSGEPELNAEVALRFFRYGQLLLGAENLTGKRRWTTGFRFFNREW